MHEASSSSRIACRVIHTYQLKMLFIPHVHTSCISFIATLVHHYVGGCTQWPAVATCCSNAHLEPHSIAVGFIKSQLLGLGDAFHNVAGQWFNRKCDMPFVATVHHHDVHLLNDTNHTIPGIISQVAKINSNAQ